MSFLNSHPFAVETFFENSLVMTYAVAKDEIKDLIPPCLTLDVFQDKWAFIAVALVKTKSLRPKGLPEFMGNDFILAGYRIFVRYTTSAGKSLRGLYILKSETDKLKMAFLGNIFTNYKYNTTDINFVKKDYIIKVESKKSSLNIAVDMSDQEVHLPTGSPFKEWKEARRFAGPLPFTFTYEAKSSKVLIIEGVRENWTPKPVAVLKCDVGFIKEMDLKESILANAFILSDIPYYWKKGRTDIWKK